MQGALQPLIGKSQLVGVGQNRLAAALVNDFDTLRLAGLVALNLLVLIGIQIAVKSLPDRGDIAVLEHNTCEVGAGDDIAPRQSFHFGKVDGNALLGQKVHNAVFPLIPAGL